MNNFFQSISKLFMIFVPINKFNIQTPYIKDDNEAMRKDWQAIGNDMKNCMK